MEQIKEESELVGKTISGAYSDYNFLYLTFKDDTYAIYSPRYSYGDLSIDIESDNYHIPLEAQMRIGLISGDEYDRFAKIERDKREEHSKEEDLKKLAQLKQKYPES